MAGRYTEAVRFQRPVVLALALLVSPVGVAVCEVVCGTPVHAAGHGSVPAEPAAVDPHAHHDLHAHHAPPPAAPVAPVSDADGTVGVVQVPGPECDPAVAIPARVRSTFSGLDLHATAIAHVVFVTNSQVLTQPRVAIADTGPPDPPRHASIPLRI